MLDHPPINAAAADAFSSYESSALTPEMTFEQGIAIFAELLAENSNNPALSWDTAKRVSRGIRVMDYMREKGAECERDMIRIFAARAVPSEMVSRWLTEGIIIHRDFHLVIRAAYPELEQTSRDAYDGMPDHFKRGLATT